MDEQERISLVKSELSKLPGKKRTGTRYSMVCCPFHADKTPSGMIKHDIAKPRSIGWFQCLGCGESVRWADFAERNNLETFVTEQPKEKDVPHTHTAVVEHALFSEDTTSVEKYDLYTLNASNASDYLGLEKPVWRTFKLSFLRSIGAEICYLPDKQRYYIWLPVRINGKLRGYIKAVPRKYKRADGTNGVSYFNAPGSWSHAYGLFPYDSAIELMRSSGLSTLVLVEGPRDALRLISKGIPAVSILGTQSWSSKKMQLLEFGGVETVVLMMDGDSAGQRAMKLLSTGQRESVANEAVVLAPPLSAVFRVHKFDLSSYPEGESLDPGNAPDSVFDDLHPLIT